MGVEWTTPYDLRPDGTTGGHGPGGEHSDVSEVLDILLGRPAWMADALCREHPELSWFPEEGESVKPMAEICERCAVREECAAYGAGERYGVWAGTSARERRRARSDSKRAF